MPECDHGSAELLMPEVPSIFSGRVMGNDQIKMPVGQELQDCPLNLRLSQRLLFRAIVQIAHFALGSQRLQDSKEPGSAVWVTCPAERDDQWPPGGPAQKSPA